MAVLSLAFVVAVLPLAFVMAVLSLAFVMAVLYGNEVLSTLVLSTKKRCFSFWKKGFWFPENLFQSSKRPKSKVSR